MSTAAHPMAPLAYDVYHRTATGASPHPETLTRAEISADLHDPRRVHDLVCADCGQVAAACPELVSLVPDGHPSRGYTRPVPAVVGVPRPRAGEPVAAPV